MRYTKYVIPIAIVIVIVLVSYVYLTGGEEKENSLSVDATYLLKKEERKEYVNVSAIIYLSNVDADSGDIKIITYLLERETGVAIDKQEKEIGNLEKDKTQEIELEMQIGNKSYNVEVLVFEDDLLKILGRGYIGAVIELHAEYYSWDVQLEKGGMTWRDSGH